MRRSFIFFVMTLVFFSCSTKTVPIKTSFEQSRGVVVEGFKDGLKIYFPLFTDSQNCFVGGDGMIIIFPNKEVMIIDGFYAEASENFVKFLKENLKIEKIDYLLATHFHGDHIGSFSKIFDSFQVLNFYSNGALTNSSTSIQLAEKIKQLRIQETTLTQGDILQIGDITIDVLWPSLKDEDVYKIFYEPGKTAETINLSSLVFKMTYKDFSILFTGDLYRKGEKQLVKKYGDFLKSTILKA